MFKRGAVESLSRAVGRLPTSAQAALESAARQAQGKGWGATTVAAEVAACLALLPPSLRRAPVVLDVGANIGEWTAACFRAAPDATIYSFEPSESAFARLTERFGGSSNPRLINTAVGRQDGYARLWADQPGSGLASLTKRRLDHLNIDFQFAEEVQLTSLDSWCERNSVTPDLLKIDVEGHEFDVLSGALNTLRQLQVVQFEFGGCNIDTRTYFQDFFYLFRDAGFAVSRLTPRGPVPVSQYSEQDEAFQVTNFIAVSQH